jgi:hypothetical protein
MPLGEGDRVTVGDGGSADLSLDGGSIIHLGPNTDFTLAKTGRGQTEFVLAFGTFLAKIQKLLDGQQMSVHSPTAVAAVRGTEFGVDVDPLNTGESHVGVFDEGRVEVRGDSGEARTLQSGQETKVSRGQAPLAAHPLERFARHREFMRSRMRARWRALGKRWKAMTPEQRQALREKIMARLRERREQRRRRTEQRRDDRQNKRKERREKRRQRRDELRRQ